MIDRKDQNCIVCVHRLKCLERHVSYIVKTLRFNIPVLDAAHPAGLLDLVTSVRGVVAALLDAPASRLDVTVSSEYSALLVKEELMRAFAVSPSVSS